MRRLLALVALALLATPASAAPTPRQALCQELTGAASCTLADLRAACAAPFSDEATCRRDVERRFRATARPQGRPAAPPPPDQPGVPDPAPEGCAAIDDAAARVACERAQEDERRLLPTTGAGDAFEQLEGGDCRGLSGEERTRCLSGASRRCAGMRGGARENCERTGSAANRHPLDHYEFDIRIDTGFDSPTGILYVALQSIVQFLWKALLYLLKGVLLMLEKALTLSMLVAGDSEIARGLSRGMDAIAAPWLLAAFGALALWVVWRGLVQRKFSAAFSGMGLSLLAVAAVGAVATAPGQTIVPAAEAVDQAALAVFGGLRAGAPADGAQARADAERSLFETVALPAWCALEFGRIEWCRTGEIPKETPNLAVETCTEVTFFRRVGCTKGPKAQTPAELFLQHPANGPEREEIYEAWKNRTGTVEQGAVQMMRRGATFTRFAVLFLIAVGLVGAIALFGAITFRLLGYAVMALVLVLFAPVMLLVACVGDGGRRAFAAWGQHLAASVIGKLIYAALLAVVLLASQVVAGIDAGGWLSGWLLVSALWWVVLLKREMFIEWLSAGSQRAEHADFGVARALGSAYFGTRLASTVGRSVARPAGWARERVGRMQTVRSEAARTAGTQMLREKATTALDANYERDRALLADREKGRERLRAVRGQLGQHDRALASHGMGTLGHREAALLRGEEKSLVEAIRSPEALRAEENVRRVAQNEARLGVRHSEKDLDAWVSLQRHELGEEHTRTRKGALGRAAASGTRAVATADSAAQAQLLAGRGVHSALARPAGGRTTTEQAAADQRPWRDAWGPSPGTPLGYAGPNPRAADMDGNRSETPAVSRGTHPAVGPATAETSPRNASDPELRRLLRAVPADPNARASRWGVVGGGPEGGRQAAVETLRARRRLLDAGSSRSLGGFVRRRFL